MAIEAKRGCGYRVVGGLYLVGGLFYGDCDRLPYPIEYCPTCGAGIKITRGFTWLDAYKMFGVHKDCFDRPACYMCFPIKDQKYGLLWVGESFYTPQSFLGEALSLGVSKRIPYIPKELKFGETVILLAHNKAFYQPEGEDGKPHDFPGIFLAFIPRAVEMLVWESELTDEKLEELSKRNIIGIPVPEGDLDHSPDDVVVGYDPVTKTFSKVALGE